MPVLLPSDPRLGANPGAAFTSPFPSNDANLSASFGSLLDAVATLPGTEPGGVMASLQAKAWTEAQRRLMFERVTSETAGGVRFDWLGKVASVAESGAVEGLFANARFRPSTSPGPMQGALAKVGIDVGLSVLTAVPVYGDILKAAIGFGAFFAGLFKKKKKAPLIVPWQEYSRDLDEDVVETILAPVLANVDWTFAYLPALESSRGFQLVRTDKGPGTRAWGVFDEQGEPRPGPGAGMMPGTQLLTQTVQVAETYRGPTSRRDAITDVGSFWPSTSQFLTGAYSMFGKRGNPDMFKMRASEAREAWRSYFESMLESAWDGWGSRSDADRLYLAKAIASFLYGKDEGAPRGLYSRLNLATFQTPWVSPDVLRPGFVPGRIYSTVERVYIRPGLRRLMRRQKAALWRSEVAALVRPETVGDLPRFAAFDDRGPPLSPEFETWGAELRSECRRARAELLKHTARYRLSQPTGFALGAGDLVAPDVRIVDPPFADELEATLTDSGLRLRARTEAPIVDPDAAAGPPPEGPGGGPPFPLPDSGALRGYLLPVLAALGVAGGVGGAAWLKQGL